MLFKQVLELRGIEQKIDTSNVTRIYVHLEDDYGESCKFPVKISDLDFKQFKKGDKVNVDFDFSVKYGSFNVVSLEKVQNGKV